MKCFFEPESPANEMQRRVDLVQRQSIIRHVTRCVATDPTNRLKFGLPPREGFHQEWNNQESPARNTCFAESPPTSGLFCF